MVPVYVPIVGETSVIAPPTTGMPLDPDCQVTVLKQAAEPHVAAVVESVVYFTTAVPAVPVFVTATCRVRGPLALVKPVSAAACKVTFVAIVRSTWVTVSPLAIVPVPLTLVTVVKQGSVPQVPTAVESLV